MQTPKSTAVCTSAVYHIAEPKRTGKLAGLQIEFVAGGPRDRILYACSWDANKTKHEVELRRGVGGRIEITRFYCNVYSLT